MNGNSQPTPTPQLVSLVKARKIYNKLPVEQSIQLEGRHRFEHGLRKYGTTLDRTDLSPLEWMQHMKEELFDAIRYTERLMREEEQKARYQIDFDDVDKTTGQE